MTYILLVILIAIISFFMFSVQFEVCVRWPNYGFRSHNDNYCFVDLTINHKFAPFLFKEAVDFCKLNGGIVDILFRGGSHRALLNMLLLSDVGKLAGVNETLWRFTSSYCILAPIPPSSCLGLCRHYFSCSASSELELALSFISIFSTNKQKLQLTLQRL